MRLKKTIFLTLAVFFLIANSAQATAIKIQPSEIKIEAEAGVLVEKKIIVENPDNNVALYEVYVDNFPNWIKIKPESFTLESGGSQKVVLKIQNQETGIFSTMLSAVARPLSERKFKAGSGVKVPLEIKIFKTNQEIFAAAIFRTIINKISTNFLIWILYIFFSCFLLSILFLRKKRKLRTPQL